MTSGTMVATAAAPVNCAMLLVRVALPLIVRLPVPVALLVALPLDAPPLAREEAVMVELPALEEARKPLQRPLLQVLYAHCESLVQAALKFPHAAIRPALLAQHCAPPEHWLGFTKGLHWAPSGREPAAAVTVEEGAGCQPAVGVLVMVAEGTAEEEDAMKPLHRPCSRLQVLNAHCWSLVHPAWKLPQRVCSMEFVA